MNVHVPVIREFHDGFSRISGEYDVLGRRRVIIVQPGIAVIPLNDISPPPILPVHGERADLPAFKIDNVHLRKSQHQQRGKTGSLVPGESGSSTNYDVGVYQDNFNEYSQTIIWRSGDATDHTAYIYLKGSPRQTGTATYTTSAVNPTFGGYQTYSSGSWGGDGNLTSKPDSSEQYQGWDEIFWTVTIYDKSSLNSEITHAKNISEQNASYQAYLVAGNWSTFTSALNTASTRLTTRAITQNELDSAENTLYNAANALVFAASDTELQAKLSEAMAIYNSNTYATDYTADSRATFEDIITRVRNSSYATTQYPAYSDSLAGSRAAQDQTVIDSLTEQVEQMTGLKDFGFYLSRLLTIDALFLNEDRHMHNIAVLLDGDGHYHYCPVFDNGCALLSDTQMDYPMGEDIITLIPQVRAKTLSRNFMEQLEAVEALYGQSLKFSYSIKEIEMLLEKEPYYPEEIKIRVRDILLQQRRTYQYLFR